MVVRDDFGGGVVVADFESSGNVHKFNSGDGEQCRTHQRISNNAHLACVLILVCFAIVHEEVVSLSSYARFLLCRQRGIPQYMYPDLVSSKQTLAISSLNIGFDIGIELELKHSKDGTSLTTTQTHLREQ